MVCSNVFLHQTSRTVGSSSIHRKHTARREWSSDDLRLTTSVIPKIFQPTRATSIVERVSSRSTYLYGTLSKLCPHMVCIRFVSLTEARFWLDVRVCMQVRFLQTSACWWHWKSLTSPSMVWTVRSANASFIHRTKLCSIAFSLSIKLFVRSATICSTRCVWFFLLVCDDRPHFAVNKDICCS